MTARLQRNARVERTPNRIRRATSRQAVLKAARSLFVKNGYRSTTVDDIARQAGLSKGGLYFYFSDKAELLHDLLLQSAELYQSVLNLLHDSSRHPLDRLIGYTNWVSKLGRKDPDSMLLPILISLEFLGRSDDIEKLVSAHYEAIYGALIAAIEDGRRRGIFNTKSGTLEQAATIVVLSDGALLEWLRRQRMLNGPDFVRAMRQFILDGIIVSKKAIPLRHRQKSRTSGRSGKPLQRDSTPRR